MGTLQYKSPDAIYHTITLEQQDGEVRLVFPPPPSWIGWLAIVSSALFAGFGLLVISLAITFAIRWGIPLAAYGWAVLVHCISAAVYLTATFYHVMHFRRWGRTPKILRATRDDLIWSAPGFWRLYERIYAVAEIESVDVLPVWDVFGRKTTFKLRCRRKRGFSIERVFTTRDPELPARVQCAFRAALQLP